MWFLPSVNEHVHLQSVGQVEGLWTKGTFVGFLIIVQEHVHFQIGFVDKCLFAYTAFGRIQPRVLLLVCVKAGCAAEGLAAYLTGERITFGMNPLVHFQSIRGAVALAADIAALGVLLSSRLFDRTLVCSHVISECVVVHKSLATFLTHERLGRSVHWHVLLQRALLTVALAARLTLVRSYALVITHVPFQVLLVSKLLPAGIACMGLLSRVNYLVLPQIGPPFESLVTELAIPWLFILMCVLVD